MKKINKQQLMLLAWQFYYQTRDDFATCLSKAWANAKLLRALHSCVCHFFYSKAYGMSDEAVMQQLKYWQDPATYAEMLTM